MKTLLVSAILVLSGAMPAFASDIPAGELDALPDRYDGRELTVVGEVVGDYSTRGDTVWIQLNDDPYVSRPLLERERPSGTNTSVAVRLPIELFDRAAWGDPGRYRTRGPILRFTGVFHHNDPERGGETYVEAQAVQIVDPSRPIGENRSMAPLGIGILLVIFGGAVLGRTWIRQIPV
jgi:hypothetical protein